MLPKKTTEELLKSIQEFRDSEAKRFFNRVGHVCLGPDADIGTSPVSDEDVKPIDFVALNERLDEDDERFFRMCLKQK